MFNQKLKNMKIKYQIITHLQPFFEALFPSLRVERGGLSLRRRGELTNNEQQFKNDENKHTITHPKPFFEALFPSLLVERGGLSLRRRGESKEKSIAKTE
jgi:hypothetical protein